MADVSEQFPELFHYTTVPSFESIYRTNTFWATHYQDLNDSTELGRFNLNVYDFIRPIILGTLSDWIQNSAEIARDVKTHGGVETVVNKEANLLLDTIHGHTFGKRTFGETFICSFCAHSNDYQANHGLLSQWRGYGADGGVAIVLNTQRMQELMRKEQQIFGHQLHHLGKVVYDSIDGDVEIKEEFKVVFEVLPKILSQMFPLNRIVNRPDTAKYFGKMMNSFVSGTTLVKHHAFHEEKEVRIVLSPRPTDKDNVFHKPEHDSKPRKDIRYRRKNDRELRYIELFNKIPANIPLPIERIIIGPSRIQNLNYQKIEELVTCADIKVDKSETPFCG